MDKETFDLKEELKKLPAKPGVYLMHDCNDRIIYVCKAVILKNRVRSYFRENAGHSPKIAKMVSHIKWFEYIVTDSELEALVLENNLIKEHRPKYNTMLKDDKAYPYIKVTVSETYPRVLFSRQMKKDKSKYFGPYTSAAAVKDTIELINKLYKLRTCNRNLPRDCGLERPCLNYHIHQCDAPCQAWISPEDYGKQVEQALEFLNGNYGKILKELEQKMEAASEAMDFEAAITWRDLLSNIRQVAQKQKMTDSGGEDRDVIGLAKAGEDAVVQVFFIRAGKLIGREHFFMTNVSEESNSQILTSFVKQFYAGTPFVPKELFLPENLEEEELIGDWLGDRKGAKVHLRVPKKGSKEKLLELANRNANLVLSQDRERLKREEGRTIGAVKELAQALGIERINRMEAFDISNINGFENVGSMVVYEKGKPKKSDYRKFRIQAVSGPDDYSCMKEVLTRRFRHGIKESRELKEQGMEEQFGKFTRFPDLLLMDGGKGQVNVALKVLDELGLSIPVCGMVKDDHHRTRGLYYNNQEILLQKNSEGFHLLTRIQDEAHRFAIEYHRQLRVKEQVHSVLDEIPGIGPRRRKILMKAYPDLALIREATIEELSQIEGIPETVAKEIYSFFRASVIR